MDEEEKPTHLDLFSGIGGFALAAKWAGFRTIGFCEIDGYCQGVLAKNFLADTGQRITWQSGNADQMPSQWNGETESANQISRSSRDGCSWIISDIRDLDGRDFAGVTLVTGGFPCQPFSCAGKRRGKEDDR